MWYTAKGRRLGEQLWDVFAISTYFTVSLVFWYIGLIPDFATIRDRAIVQGVKTRATIYNALSFEQVSWGPLAAAAVGEEARPREREPVGVQAQVLHERDVLRGRVEVSADREVRRHEARGRAAAAAGRGPPAA